MRSPWPVRQGLPSREVGMLGEMALISARVRVSPKLSCVISDPLRLLHISLHKFKRKVPFPPILSVCGTLGSFSMLCLSLDSVQAVGTLL